ncbi:MAG: transposase [Candidatus Binatia bacterium]
MTQHSQSTRVAHYINTLMPEAHGHQRKAFSDFVAALLVVRTCCQATLARYFSNFEAASRRLTRWLHNARVDVQVQAHAHAQLLVHQLPSTGQVRVAIDWTTEDQQHLLVASMIVGRRAVPLYWEAYTTKERKGQQRAIEVAFLHQVVEQELSTVARDRLLVTADRGFGDGTLLTEWARLQLPFVLRLAANITVCLDQQWQKLGSLRRHHTTRRRALGRLWCLRSNPQRCWVTQARARNKKGHWEYWHLVSNHPLSAFTMAQEYARRFGCEEGFRDAKRTLGFAATRIAQIEAWARMFALVAAALILTQWGTRLLTHPQRQIWVQQVRSRRQTRSELSVITVVCHLLDQGITLWSLLTPHAKLNLEAAL